MYVRALLWGILAVSLALESARATDPKDEIEWFTEPHPPVIQALKMLSEPEVARELQLSEECREKIARWRLEAERRSLQNHRNLPKTKVFNEEFQKNAQKFRAAEEALETEYQPLIWGSLDKPQRHRFQQLIWQIDMGRALLRDQSVIQHISLTREQNQEIQNAMEKYREEIRSIHKGGEKIRERVSRTAAKRDRRIISLLTDAQKSAWSRLTGEPLDLHTQDSGAETWNM